VHLVSISSPHLEGLESKGLKKLLNGAWRRNVAAKLWECQRKLSIIEIDNL